MEPQITIAIPVFNVEKYIERCLISVINQTFNNIEILFVNDKTKDKSVEIIKRYARIDSRIRIVEHNENLGLMYARKTGYENAKGKYIFFLDGDDALPNNALELLFNEAEKTNSDFVAGRMSYITPNGIDNDSYPCKLKYGNDKLSVVKSTLLWEITHNLCGKLFRKQLFDEKSYITFRNCTIGEDGLLFYQLLDRINKASCIDGIVYYYYQNPTSSTQVRYNEKALRSFFLFLDLRYKIVNNYVDLRDDLNKATIKKIADLRSGGYSFSLINKMLKETAIPFQLCFKSIIKYCNYREALKLLILVYILGPFNIVRN